MPNQSKTAAPSVTSFAELQKLTPSETAVRIVEQGNAAHRAFLLVAKLMLVLEAALKPGQTLGAQVIKLANVPAAARRRVKSTVDNARQAMRVWKELVEPGHVPEAVFDGFTYHDCVCINRVMSGGSRQKLDAMGVALVINDKPGNWHEELECLAAYGQTLEERAAADKAPATEPQPAAPEGGSPAPSGDTKPPEGDGTTPPPAENAPPEPDGSDKVIAHIGPATKPTADDVFKLISAIESLISDMEPGEVAKAAVAIAELNTTVQESIKPAAKKTTGGRKTVKSKAAKAA